MIDIIGLLRKKCEEYDPYNDDDISVQTSLNENRRDVYIVLKEGFLQYSNNESVTNFNKKYYVVEEFSLGRPFVTSECHFSLIHVRKKKRKKYRVGIFNGASYDAETMVGAAKKLVVPPAYNHIFCQYIDVIEAWINNSTNLENESNGAFEFVEVDYPDEIQYPRYYSTRSNLVRTLLDRSSILRLSEIADVLYPCVLESEETAAIANIDEQKPYRYDNISILYGHKTDIKIQDGDILFPRLAVDAKPFLATKKSLPDIDIYAGESSYVIRAKQVVPEYLWLYLISDVSLCINEEINSQKLVKFLSSTDLENFPVIRQELPDEEYVRLCEILNSPSERRYNTHSLATYEQLKTGRIENTNDVLNMELMSTINLHYADQLDNMITADLQELNACYRYGAYKAVLILAGSILEAVLIDWLSEMNGVDYFAQDYMVSNGHGGQKRADLIDYINQIKYIKMPAWVSEASKAHVIRQKRNLVHAKLCLNTDDINKDVCNMVIEYLKDVLISRGVYIADE